MRLRLNAKNFVLFKHEVRKPQRKARRGRHTTTEAASEFEDAIRLGDTKKAKEMIWTYDLQLVCGQTSSGQERGWTKLEEDDVSLSPLELAAAMRREETFIDILRRHPTNIKKLVRKFQGIKKTTPIKILDNMTIDHPLDLAAAFLGPKAIDAAFDPKATERHQKAVMLAITFGSLENLRHLHRLSPIKDRGKGEDSLLVAALRDGRNPDTYKFLLEVLDPQHVGHKTMTPFHALISYTDDYATGRASITATDLLSKTIKKLPHLLTIENKISHSTPLAMAAYHGQLEATKLIAKASPPGSFSHMNSFGSTPLMDALLGRHREIALHLMQVSDEGSFIIPNDRGWTPAHLAARNGYDDLLTMILERYPSQAFVKTMDEKTLLDVAQSDATRDIIQKYRS